LTVTVQLHKAMLMQEVQQLKSANVPKAEAYKRLNKEGKKISWPTFLGILQRRRGAECRKYKRELRKTEGL